MAPQPIKHARCTRKLAFFLPTLLLSSPTAALAAVVPTSYSSHCASPSPAPDRHADVSNDAEAELLSSFHLQPSTGFFSGRGADSLFSPNTNSDQVHGRSLVFLPRGVSRTADPTLLHLTATLVLFGCRVKNYEFDDRPESYRRNNHSSPTISFNLDGYYSSTFSELCMVSQVSVVSTGTEAADDILMTVHFTSFKEPQGFGHGKGRISSLRDSTDDLYFETRDIIFFGMGMGNRQQVSASIWRMDPERVVAVASTTLSCVFTALWRLRDNRRRRNQVEPPAMSMAMLVVIISLGCVALKFILSHWVFFLVTFVHMFS